MTPLLQVGILSAITFAAVARPLALEQPAQLNQVGQQRPMSLQPTQLLVGNEGGINLTAPASPPGGEADELGQGLALYLPFTTDLKDHSPAALPIKVVGSVHIGAEGAIFGGEDWLTAPHIALNDRPFAIAFWMRDTTAEQSVGLVEQLDPNKNLKRRHLHIVLRKNRQPFFGFYPGHLLCPLNVPTNQDWVHFVFQYNGAKQEIWINGRLICTRKIEPYEGTAGITAIGKIPRWSNVPGKNFQGCLLDFRVYQRTLDQREIEGLASVDNSALAVAARAVQKINSPDLSRQARSSREAMARVLPSDISLPFLEIDEHQITINGQAGQIYSLESTTDFNQWTEIALLTNQTGRVVYDWRDAATGPQWFFRVQVNGLQP
jgi:hypothetical protein